MRLSRLLPACAAAALLAAAPPVPPPQPVLPSWRNPAPDPLRGAALAQSCLACHATAAAPRLSRQRQSYLFRAILAYRDTTRSSAVMAPAAAPLTDQDARDLAAHLAGKMRDSPPPVRDDLPGFALTLRECGWCHGETGIGEFEGMPVLAGQDAAYLAAALAAYRDGTRTDPTMAAVAAGLSDEAIDQASEYYAGHQWLERGR